MSGEWGAPCPKCGHPASYHGVTFCMVDAGSTTKRRCDCDGYAHEVEPLTTNAAVAVGPWVPAELRDRIRDVVKEMLREHLAAKSAARTP